MTCQIQIPVNHEGQVCNQSTDFWLLYFPSGHIDNTNDGNIRTFSAGQNYRGEVIFTQNLDNIGKYISWNEELRCFEFGQYVLRYFVKKNRAILKID